MSWDDTEDRYAGLAWAVVARIPTVLTEVRERLAEGQPDYAAVLDEAYEEIVGAAPACVLRLVEDARTGEQASEGIEKSLFEEIGRVHRRDGNLLLALGGGPTAASVGAGQRSDERQVPAAPRRSDAPPSRYGSGRPPRR